MRMNRTELKKYFTDWERGTLDTIEAWASRSSTSSCFYGRNVPRSQAGICDPQKVETWHITGYSSTRPQLEMALRHNRTEILKWHARNVKLALEVIPWWIETWGKPPGEDARLFGICGETRESIIAAGNHGDSDIKRHFNANGLLCAMISEGVRVHGNWTDTEIQLVADKLTEWIWGRRASVFENPREYLRYGNDIDTLNALVTVYGYLNQHQKATSVYETLKAFIRVIFSAKNQTTFYNMNGIKWHDFNYGDMVERHGNFYEPFSYGFYPYGMQAWYRGHLLGALIHAAHHAIKRNDTVFFVEIVNTVDILTRWFDPTRRIDAPIAPEVSDGSIQFHNCVLQGGFVDPSRTILRVGEQDTTLTDWESVTEQAKFRRYAWHDTGVGGWMADGGYWETDYVDPGGTIHVRKHNSGGANLYVPQLPGLETANGYECVDGLFARAAIFSDQNLMDFARIVLFQHIGYCNRSDTVVSIGDRLKNGIIEGASLVGKPGRPFHWALECGSEIRALDVGAVDGGMDLPPSIPIAVA